MTKIWTLSKLISDLRQQHSSFVSATQADKRNKLKEVAAISKSWFTCPQDYFAYLLHKLCMFLVGFVGEAMQEQRGAAAAAQQREEPSGSCCRRHSAGASSCSAHSVANTRPAQLDLLLISLHTFAKGRSSPQTGWMLGLALLPESSTLLASCWPSCHHCLAGLGEKSWDSNVSSFSRALPIAWLMGSFCVMPRWYCWQGHPLTAVFTTGWKTGSTSGPKPGSILSVLAATPVDSGSITSACHYVVSCSSLL